MSLTKNWLQEEVQSISYLEGQAHFRLVYSILDKDSSGGFSINIEVLRNDVLQDIKYTSTCCKLEMHRRLR